MSSLRAVVERSSSIWERLDGRFIPIEDSRALANWRLTQWIQSTASGRPDLFDTRLAREHITHAAVSRGLLDVRLRDDHPLPDWTRMLEALMAAARYLPAPSSTIAFSEVLTAFVDVASERLQHAASGTLDLLTAEAFQQSQLALLTELSALFAPAIASDLALARHLKQLQGETAEERYQHFLETHLGSPEALDRFFIDYPVLARIVAARIEAWIDATAELLGRLQDDGGAIAAAFNRGQPLGRVDEIKGSLSDPHHGGRRVASLRFESGVRVVYKPKDLGSDAAFRDLVTWLNQQGLSLALRAVEVINRGTHGWSEFVAPKACSGEQGATDYYRRSGMLLGLLYVLGGTDSHAGNLIAAGDTPVLIDLETLLRLGPPLAGAPSAETVHDADELFFQDSVLSTGLLPRWRFGRAGGRGVDVSGLSAVNQLESPYSRTTWTRVSPDRIEATVSRVVSKRSANQPMLGGEPADASRYLNELVAGFEEVYQFILNDSARFRDSAPTAALASQSIRYLNRSTAEYAMVLERSLDVDSLRDGVHRSIRLDLLSRSLLSANRGRVWTLNRAERESLERLDIPHFTSGGDSTTLKVGIGEVIPGFFARTAREILVERIDRLSAADLHQQMAWIRGAFAARYGEPGAPRTRERIEWTAQMPLSRDVFIDVATEIADRLIERAVPASHDSVTWLGVEFLPAAEQYQLQPMSVGLYGGLAGVMLFFAAMEQCRPGMGYADYARRTVAGLRRRRCLTPRDRLNEHWGLGGMTGIPSVAYSLGWSSRLLHDSAVLDEASAWGAGITREAITSCRVADFLTGLAGTIPALLSLHSLTGDEHLLARAVDCGERLLELAPDSAARPAGFAHGASGIGYALRLLHRACGDERFLSAAAHAFAHESPERSSTLRWCRGAAGIGLSRLVALDNAELPRAVEEVRASLDAVLAFGVAGADTLCCGNSGQVDILLTAGKRLSNQALVDAAHRQMSAVIRRSQSCGSFYLGDDDVPVTTAGMFKGLAGIGYTCLRLADEGNTLPSLLLMESPNQPLLG